MTKIAIINDKTGKIITRNVEISDLIDNDGNQFSQAVSKDGLIARLRREDGEKVWYLAWWIRKTKKRNEGPQGQNWVPLTGNYILYWPTGFPRFEPGAVKLCHVDTENLYIGKKYFLGETPLTDASVWININSIV